MKKHENNKEEDDLDKTENDEFIKNITEFFKQQKFLSDSMKKLIAELEKKNFKENK